MKLIKPYICKIFSSYKDQYYYLSTLISLLLFIAVCSVALFTPAAQRYEISLYRAFPTFFWFSCFTIITLSSLNLISYGINKNISKRNIYRSLVVLSLLFCLLVLLPHFRYYLYGAGDLLHHVGYVKDILGSGGIENNIYPFIHILGAELVLIGGKTAIEILPYLTLYWIIALPLFVIILMRLVINDRKQLFVAFPIILIALLGLRQHHFEPSRYSRFLFPLILFLILKPYKNRDKRFILLMVIFFIILPVIHIATALHMLLILSFIFIVLKFYSIDFIEYINDLPTKNVVYILTMAILSSLVIYLWGLKNDVIYSQAQATISSGSLYSTASSYFGIARTMDLVSLAIYTYGRNILIYFLVCSLLLINRIYSFTQGNIRYSILKTLFLILLILFPLTPFISIPIYISRMMTFLYMIAIILLGLEIHNYLNSKQDILNSELLITVVLLMVLIYLSIFSLYGGPHLRSPNQQTTKMELTGTSWLTTNHDPTIEIEHLGVKMFRFSHATNGFENRISSRIANPHFKYNSTENSYLIVSRQGRIAYPELYPDYREFWEYYPSDFRELKTIDRIYFNSDVEIYLRN